MHASKLAQEQRNEVGAGAGRGPDCKHAAKSATLLLAQLVEELSLELEELPRPLVQVLAGLGRLDAPPGTVEQPTTEAFLEGAHLQADGWLRHPEPLGSLREAPPLDDLAERGKLTRIHKKSLWQGFGFSWQNAGKAR
jgi:hypothetical protein